MPTTPKSNRRGGGGGQEVLDRNRRNRLTQKSSSFHGKIPAKMPEARMRRPKTLPDLLSGKSVPVSFPEARPKLTKLLLNVTVQGSVGAVQVLTSPESTVGDLIASTVRQYTKEARRPILTADPSKFDLHYSQFSLESLDREEKLMALGSRNFFLCSKKAEMDGASCSNSSSSSGVGIKTSSSASCSKEVEKEVAASGFPWLKFMGFML